jgi:galactofuranose transport system ATP-binding protein
MAIGAIQAIKESGLKPGKYIIIVSRDAVRGNIILAIQARRGIFRTIPSTKQEEIVDQYIRALGIKTPRPEQILSN